ncbi:NAD(P)/FAD-dependent oxidoreductase [Actinomadura latina]|uniref:FAD-binding oxidoreductase n=1 Tax=Actinomadura latina TaxID=163603 RepID=A0A846YZZ5_9ACTN|nr:FAD-dependent oxidoreductase [Actinomadura latina]NKZ05257.1 FAD-binding oxidoreductase [Actinomadura latina]
MRIVIVGGGIIGAALADRLSRGTNATGVTLVERDRPGAGTSGASFAWLNANDPSDPAYHSLRVAALGTWRRLAAGFGDPDWFRITGNTAWAVADDAKAELADRAARLSRLGYAAAQITGARLRDVEPALRPASGALIVRYPDEGYVHGPDAVAALVERARTAGARLITGTSADRLNLRGDRVTGVRLATGDDLDADLTICAAGWRSPALLATAGLRLPMVDTAAPGSEAPGLTATTTPAAPGLINGVVHSPGIDVRPTPEHRLVLEAGDLDTATDLTTPRSELDSRAAELLDRARALIPSLRARIAEVHRCVRPLPADGFPLIGRHAPGLYTAVTHSGMTLGPHLADLIAGDLHEDEPALARYRPDRPTRSPARIGDS